MRVRSHTHTHAYTHARLCLVHGSAGRAYMRACRRAVGRSGGRAVRQAGGRCASEVQETYTTHESQVLVVIPMPSQAMARNRSSAGLVGSCTVCRRLPPVHWVFIPSKKGTWFGVLTFWVKLPRDIESHILARTACLLEVCERLTIDEMPYLVGCNVQIGRPQSSSNLVGLSSNMGPRLGLLPHTTRGHITIARVHACPILRPATLCI